MYKEIFRLINIIGQNHKKFSSGLSNELSKDNYKKKTMDKLVYSDDNKFNIEQNFKEFLLKYQEKLLEFQDNYNFTSNNELIDTRYREKSIESIFNKIRYFNSEENIKKVPIQKCLNDIAGFRIILETNDDYDYILNSIVESTEIKFPLFRPYLRKDDNYIAIHIYFKSDSNFYLPWELQIWKKCDEEKNETSHRNHKEKRKPISWPILYKGNKFS